ncbi:ribokinase [Pseudonocardia kongjuensis]|uniref:Ribokinase n=1 Tax=Pseudonocardia kongjuensis TaxID=102227 RepID=A0ABP4IVP4_9PSEU
MSGSDVVVVGAVNVDMVVATTRLPGPGETVVGPAVQRHGGGKGANAAVAAARAGARVRYIGAVGDDALGTEALDELRSEQVDVSAVTVAAGVSTGAALIVVDDAGENQIAVGAGANAALEPGAVAGALRAALPAAGCVLVSTEIPGPAVAAAVRAATAAGVPCVLNPAPVVPVVVELFDAGPVLTPNAGELADLAAAAGVPGEGPRERAAALAARTGAAVVVTLGAQGALLAEPGGEVLAVPPRPTEVRDTTGAGDTFNGVLAARLAAGTPLRDAVAEANVAASLSVREVGARGGMPTADRLRAEV